MASLTTLLQTKYDFVVEMKLTLKKVESINTHHFQVDR